MQVLFSFLVAAVVFYLLARMTLKEKVRSTSDSLVMCFLAGLFALLTAGCVYGAAIIIRGLL